MLTGILVAYGNKGIAFGIIVLALWFMFVMWLRQTIKQLKKAGNRSFNLTPLYLILLPSTLVFLRVTLFDTTVAFSRNYAIKQSERLIRGIENYYKENGHYPISLPSDPLPTRIGNVSSLIK